MNTCYTAFLSKRCLNLKYSNKNNIQHYLKNIQYNALSSLSSSGSIINNKPSEKVLFQRVNNKNDTMLKYNNKNNIFESKLTRTINNNRLFSSTTIPTNNNNSNTDDNKKNKKEEEDDSNIFLDNLGKVFFGVIFTIIFLLVRSSRGTTNRANLREYLESISLLDPCEIDDLRVANSLLTPEIFRDIMNYVLLNNNTNNSIDENNKKINYCNFLSLVKYKMKELKGEEFTIQLGHLLDRIVIHKLENKSNDNDNNNDDNNNINDEDESLRLDFLLTLLSLSLSCTMQERIDILYEIMLKTGNNENNDSETSSISEEETIQMISNLQETYQLDNDAQILDVKDKKYPFQEYKQGLPIELIEEARKEYNEKYKILLKKGSYNEFDALLRSQYICAWGECYGHREVYES